MIYTTRKIRHIFIGTKRVEHINIGNVEFYQYIEQITLPSTAGTYTYNGFEQTVILSGYDANKMTISGEINATSAGQHIIGFTPKSGYAWTINPLDVSTKYVTWTIAPRNLSTASLSAISAQTYNGSPLTPIPTATVSWMTLVPGTDYNCTYANNINAGTATVYVNGIGNFTGQATTTFVINKGAGAITSAPSARRISCNGTAQAVANAGSGTGTLYYKLDNGSFSTSIPTATDAGTYTLYYYAAESANAYQSATYSIQCTMDKGAGYISLDPQIASLNLNETKTITITRPGNGSLSVSTSTPSLISVSLSGTTITLQGLSGGNASFTVNLAASSNYYSATTTATFTVNSYNYGDGSKNLTTDGYKGLLYVNGSKFTTATDQTNHAGNIQACLTVPLTTVLQDNGSSVSSSTNYMLYGSSGWSKTDSHAQTFTHTALNGEYTMCYYWHGGGWIVSHDITNFKLTIDGSSYTLQQAVNSSLIKPLVIMWSGASGVGDWSAYNQTSNNILRLYNASGGTRTSAPSTYGTGDADFGGTLLWFMTNTGHSFTGATFNAVWTPFGSSTSYLSGDGLSISYCPIANYRLTLNAY